MHRAAFLRVAHDEPRARAAELARIADLAAAFRVERRAVEHDLAFVASVERVAPMLPPFSNATTWPTSFTGLVAQELRLAFDA